MTTITTASNAFTVDDLDALPADGRKYELIGGSIVMTHAPEPVHQRVSRRLERLIEDACPPGYEMFHAPVDYDLPSGDRVQPDIVVAPDSTVGRKRLLGPVLLCVEIVSPGSGVHDTITKRHVYAGAGVPAYWIVDHHRGRFTALRLTDGEYVASVDTSGPVTVEWPVAVSFDVAALARR